MEIKDKIYWANIELRPCGLLEDDEVMGMDVVIDGELYCVSKSDDDDWKLIEWMVKIIEKSKKSVHYNWIQVHQKGDLKVMLCGSVAPPKNSSNNFEEVTCQRCLAKR